MSFAEPMGEVYRQIGSKNTQEIHRKRIESVSDELQKYAPILKPLILKYGIENIPLAELYDKRIIEIWKTNELLTDNPLETTTARKFILNRYDAPQYNSLELGQEKAKRMYSPQGFSDYIDARTEGITLFLEQFKNTAKVYKALDWTEKNSHRYT